MILEDFRWRFPEFRSASDGLVSSALDGAAAGMDEDVYGDLYDEAHGYLTAHKLVTSAFGKDSRMVDDERASTYWKEFVRIRRECAPRMLLT
jgi:hypothetical protein